MIELIGGRFPEDTDPTAGEPVEVLISIQCMENLEFVLGQSYQFTYVLNPNPDAGRYERVHQQLPFQIVGVFQAKDEYDLGRIPHEPGVQREPLCDRKDL